MIIFLAKRCGGEPYPSTERRGSMAMHVCWINDLDKARKTARETNKPVLLDFFNPK
jgi:hypothetical protein